MTTKKPPTGAQQRCVRVTVDFTLLFDEPQTQLPRGLMPNPGDTLLDFLAAGCEAVGITDAVIQPRSRCHIRFVKRLARPAQRKGKRK